MKNPFMKMLASLLAAILFAMGSAFATEDLRADADNFYANPDEAYEKLVSRVEKASHSNSFKGSVLIATEDEIILFGGVSTMTTEGTPADLHTTYNIGSCSKFLRPWQFSS